MYKPLIGDYCAECRSVRAYNLNKFADKVYDEVVVDETPSSGGSMKDFNAMLVKQYNKAKELEEREPTYEEAYEEAYNRVMTMNRIPQDLAKKFKVQLNYLMKRYMFHLLSGNFRLADKDSYMKNHIGSVVEIKGRWVVYKIEAERTDGVPIELRPEVQELIVRIEAGIQAVREQDEANNTGIELD
jgi:hypothetical protein